MKLILFYIFIFFSLNLFGQINNNFELTKDSDTTNYFEYVKPTIEKLNLIEPINNKFIFGQYLRSTLFAPNLFRLDI